MTQRAFGYVHRNPSLKTRLDSANRSRGIAAGFTPTRHPEFAELWGEPLDQGPLSACTGYALTKQWELKVALLLKGSGVKAPITSPLALYTWGRRHGQPKGPLYDEGAFTGDVLWSLLKLGPCPDHNWPSREAYASELAANVNRIPGPDAAMAAKRLKSVYPSITGAQIVARGPRLVERVLHSLDLGESCGIAIPVGEQFIEGRGLLDATPVTDIAGFHQVLVLDWRNGVRGYEFLLGNSWGYWGGETSPRGTQWCTAALLGQSSYTHYLSAGIT